MADGDMSLYNEDKVLAMRRTIARVLLLALSLVRIEVFAGSVIIEATVEVPATDAAAKKADLERGFGSSTLLASQLNVTALSEPTISTQAIGSTPTGSTSPSDDNELSGGVIAAIVILVLAFATLVPLLAYHLYQKNKNDDNASVTVTSNTKRAPPAQPDAQ